MKISEELDPIVRLIEHNLNNVSLADATRETLSRVLLDIQDGASRLRSIEQFVEFADLPENLSRQDFDTLPIRELVKRSRLLRAMTEAGVTIDGRHVFSSKEERLSRSLAANYAIYSGMLSALRRSRKAERNDFLMTFSGGPGVYGFLELMRKSKVLRIDFLRFKKDEEKWVPHKYEYLKNANESQTFQAFFDVTDAELYQFLQGDWLTALTAHVIIDQSEKMRVQAETFAKLRYHAPVEVVNSSSDLDVVSLFKNHAFCFECKSGKLDERVCAEIIRKSNELRMFVDRFVDDIRHFLFFVVADPELNDFSAFKAQLLEAKIILIEVKDLREMLIEIAKADDF